MMKQGLQRLVLLAILGAGLVLLLSGEPTLITAHAEGLRASDRVSLTGRLTDPQGEPIRGAAVEPLLNGLSVEHSSESQEAHALFESQANVLKGLRAFATEIEAETGVQANVV